MLGHMPKNSEILEHKQFGNQKRGPKFKRQPKVSPQKKNILDVLDFYYFLERKTKNSLQVKLSASIIPYGII